MPSWMVERIVHFDSGDFVRAGTAHFGFHVRNGRYFAIEHQNHYLGLIGADGSLEWTVSAQPVLEGVPNIHAELEFPIFIDVLADETLVVSNFGNAHLYRIDTETMSAQLLVDGRRLGLADMGNCVVDDEGTVWVNEVKSCRLWRFDATGRSLLTLGDGNPGFQPGAASFDSVRFNWVYDIRRGPEGTIFVLDSKNYAVRVIGIASRRVRTVAGIGTPGYTGDGGDARNATFGGVPTAAFDGPFSLSVDEEGNAYVGDRYNHVVRMIEASSGIITTIAGSVDAIDESGDDPAERDPLRLNLPKISSMDYDGGRLFIPTDLANDSGDLVILHKE